MSTDELPLSPALEAPIVRCLEEQPGPMKNAEMDALVALQLGLSDEQLKLPHDLEKRGARTEFAYRMAWARTRLKARGVLERRELGEWALSGR